MIHAITVGDTLSIREGDRELFAIRNGFPITIEILENLVGLITDREQAAYSEGRDEAYQEGYDDGYYEGRSDCDCEEAA